MKKIKLILLMALIGLTLLLCACSKEPKVSSVTLKGYDPETPIEIEMGEFDYEDYTLLVTYDSGTVEEYMFDSGMITPSDRLKFYQIGDHTITLLHGKNTGEFKISVKRSSFDEAYFESAYIFQYDGEAHVVEVEGNVPANAVITYPGGNRFVNAGTYGVTAVITCDGYVSKTISTTVTVERAKFDMSDIKFESKEFVYDGRMHSLSITGTLPEGLNSPTYYINGNKVAGAVDAGNYTVQAIFSAANANYEPIAPMEATLKILPAEHDFSDLDIIFATSRGVELQGKSKVYDTQSVHFSISDRKIISNKASVVFTVTDEEGNALTDLSGRPITAFTDAGKYTVTAEFVLYDAKNYNPIDPIVREFEIKKAVYDTSGIYFDPDLVVYDGKLHNLTVKLPIGHAILPTDITYEYYLEGELQPQENNEGVSEVGVYTVIAIFTVRDKNYEQIPDMDETLIIEEAPQ